ncbi:hypothetical protein RI367_003605 [Sorochytrium milnesiophthora]
MPPKKKKAGSAKLPKTASQLLRVEDERRKQSELEVLRRKAKFESEEKTAHLSMFKIQNTWKEIMKEVKANSLRQQLTLLQQLHERHNDRQTYQLKQAAETLVEADAQYETILQSHLSNIDALNELQNNRLNTIKQQFDSDLGNLEVEFGVEKATIFTKNIKDRSDILGIITRVDRDFQETQADMQHEFQSVRDDVKNKNLEEKHALRIQLEGTIEELWKHFQTALSNYNAATADRKKSFEELKARDEESAHVIEDQLRKLAKLSEKISHLKARLGGTARDADGKLAALRTAKEDVSRNFQVLKKSMNAYQSEEKKKLVELTRISGRCMKELKKKVELAEKMVKLSEMNSKFETEQEKIACSNLDASTAVEESVVDGGLSEGQAVEMMGRMQIKDGTALPLLPGQQEPTLAAPHVAELYSNNNHNDQIVPADPSKVLAPLTNFYKRYNKVLLNKLALEATKTNLESENQTLRALLKSYLDGISVNEEVMQAANPLFVVNGKTNVNLYV